MAANTSPVFGRTPKTPYNTILTGNTSKDGTSGTLYTLQDGGSTDYIVPADGAILRQIRFVPLGTNIASVARVFLNNGSATGTAANNRMITNGVTLPATTNSETAGLNSDIVVPFDMKLQAGFEIFLTIATTVAAGWAVVAEIEELTA